jgi:DNA-binding MarR family transcriptional regulator
VTREDLGARLAKSNRRLIAAEQPVLERHGLTMWEYIALSTLAVRPSGTQLALAESIGYDKTRLIVILDRLQSRGLIGREPDPSDRRAHVVSLTPAGEAIVRSARRDIRAMEDELLAGLSAQERDLLDVALFRLAGQDESAQQHEL